MTALPSEEHYEVWEVMADGTTRKCISWLPWFMASAKAVEWTQEAEERQRMEARRLDVKPTPASRFVAVKVSITREVVEA